MTEQSVAQETLVDTWDDEARRRISKVYALLLELLEQDTSDIADQPTDQRSELTDDSAAQQEGEA